MSTPDSFFGKPWLLNLIVALILVAGLGVRMTDLTDLPLDFHPTRQLFSAIKARGMYYQYASGVPEWQRDMALQQWKDEATIEPQVMERLVAGTYFIFGEHLWIARIYSSLFWLLGGLAVFALARRIASTDGAILSLLYFVFLPFAIVASRSFQPDPLMITLIAAGLWAFQRWNELNSWRWCITAGVFSGLAIFVKNVAVFPILGAFALSILNRRGFKAAIEDRQVVALAFVTVLPAAIYTLAGVYISGFLREQFAFRFFPGLWTTPSFYIQWAKMAASVVDYRALLLGVFGIFLADARRERPLLMGLWLGYIVYGFTFAYHITTHNYYQLPLILIVGLSLAPVGRVVFEKLSEFNPGSLWARSAVAAVILVAVIIQAWLVGATLLRNDYRPEAEFWRKLGDQLGHTSSVAGLTQDYGMRLAYFGWQNSTQWLDVSDRKMRELAGLNVDFPAKFKTTLQGKRFFVVTLLNDLNKQPVIKEMLYKSYPIFSQARDYVIFDLQHPLANP